MLILALETSTDLGSCALWHNGHLVERRCPPALPHSQTLLPLVRELLNEAGASIGQLDAIAFGVGPGAFTGLRVACGVAQGLAMVADTPLIPVTSLEVMATASGGGQVLTLLDARMGEVYYAIYQRLADDDYRLQGDIRLASPTDIVLPEGADWLACGNAIPVYADLQPRLSAAGIRVQAGILPTAAVLARLAAPRARRNEGIDAALAAPLYIRDKVAKTVAERLHEGGRA